MTNEKVIDINEYKCTLDEESSYPIYMIFEVIHIERKTQCDEQDEYTFLRHNL